MSPNHLQRLQSFQKKMIQENVDAAFISKKENIFYLSGFISLTPTEREAYLIITHDETVLFHSPFIEPNKNTRMLLTTIPMSADYTLTQILTTYLSDTIILGIEKLDLTVAEAERCLTILPHTSVVSIDNMFKSMRQIKDKFEIDQIHIACQIAQNTMKWIYKFVRSDESVGITEAELFHQINRQFIEFGADGTAFPTIVAFDEHTASPHHIPSDKKLTTDSIVLIDMGALYKGYKSDMTRTWCLSSSPPPLFSQIEHIVKTAYSTAKKLLPLKKTTTASDIDTAARSSINNAGYGENFIHTTGHGIGLEAHESPSLNLSNQEILKPGMVITIEPGIYFPGQFGYRHEDTFILK